MYDVPHFVGGERYRGQPERHGDVFNPTTGEVIGRVGFAEKADMDHAVRVAQAAHLTWAEVNPQRRARVMFEYKRLLTARTEELARAFSLEHGKTLADARGEFARGHDVLEFACGIPHLIKGEFTEGAGPGIDMYSMRLPLGVVAGITPFNFPAMTSMWMWSIAIACGNAVIMKPSEKVPTIMNKLAELFLEAGGPPGILNIVHGDKSAVDAILEHPLVRAVSFIGSSDVAQYVYAKGAAFGKRVQAMGSAKNHGVVMPDADLDQVAHEMLGAAYGSAGERCMALPVVMPVGKKAADGLRARLEKGVETVRVGLPDDDQAQFGAVISKAHFERVKNYIQMGVDEGAELVVDGRKFALQGYENGYLMGPSLFDHVKPEMRSYKEEIFGPVLQIVRADTYEDALRLVSDHQFGNGVAIFTRNGRTARDFAKRVNVGMVGINVPLPVPLAYHSFGGWKRSGYGDHNQHGMEGVRFYTKVKTVTQRWPADAEEGGKDAGFVLPTM